MKFIIACSPDYLFRDLVQIIVSFSITFFQVVWKGSFENGKGNGKGEGNDEERKKRVTVYIGPYVFSPSSPFNSHLHTQDLVVPLSFFSNFH